MKIKLWFPTDVVVIVDTDTEEVEEIYTIVRDVLGEQSVALGRVWYRPNGDQEVADIEGDADEVRRARELVERIELTDVSLEMGSVAHFKHRLRKLTPS
ncbi:MAG TPA: hypothetical protein VLI07_18655 [Candidatus Binatus sp.]|nr:hypothetical protein [Candidatus Binatus sp.]